MIDRGTAPGKQILLNEITRHVKGQQRVIGGSVQVHWRVSDAKGF